MRRNYSKFIVVLFIGVLLLFCGSGALFSLDDIEKNASSGNTRSYTDLTGRVVGSDWPENGLPSANVTLMGEVTYNAITDEAGYFNLYSVATGKEYQLRVTIEGYESLTETVYIREGDIDLGILLLLENAYPPNRLTATQNSDDSQVILNWGMPIPVTHYFYDFEGGESGWTSGVISGVDQWECGTPNQSNISSAYSGQNAFMTRLSLPYDNQVNVWLQSPEFNFSFFSEPYLSVWLNIYCENNFDAMILESSIDGGRSWEKVEGDDGFYNNRSSLGPLRGPKWSGRIGVWEEYSTSLPGLANEPSVYLRFRFQSDESIAYEGVAIDDFKIIDQSLRGRGRGAALRSSKRGFEEFLVYRFPYDELDNVEEWSSLGTVSDTTFIDEEWSAIENGYYGYGVRALYTNGVTSDPALSNWVAKGYTGVAYVHLSVDSGDSGEGSLVELTYLDETPDGKPLSYSEVTQGGHPSIAEFRNILLGRYSVIATKAGFEPYIIDEVVIDDQSVIEVEIQELPLPPRRLAAGASNNVVNLSWQPPIPDNGSRLSNSESRALLGYNVYRDEALITQTPIIETNYRDSEVENGREYSYYVTALYSLAESEGSNQVTATPGANQTIRIGEATEKDYTLPLNFWYKNSLTQTIYYKDEINNGGVLEKICYFYDFTSEIINTPIKVWMAEDNISTLSNEWLPSSEMVLVYDGGIDIAPGEGWLEIVLDRYFFYSGSGNLVVMVQRPMDIDFYASTDRFYYSITEDYPYRSRNIHSDDEVFNPDEIIGGTLSSRVPYTELFMITSGMGSISGYVTDESSNPLAGVIITVDGSEFQAKSDESGYYEFKYIKGGLHKVKGVKFGYYDVVIENVDVVEDQDSKVNFGMSTIKRVSLNGRVVGSDWPDVGLEGAIVRLMGYQDYEAVTDTDGNFEIAEVYSGRSYNVEVERGGYVEIYFELEVEYGDILLEDIVLLERALPPTNIYAEIID
ncbi:MAG: carboxypeptidase regulatory-like domain-containing protein, partial [Candidatus Cloacimonas sp.]|nr:carboxypeptidase regulatory-like domain-containing protein [Candidatus Cloacimonadota bacterium]